MENKTIDFLDSVDLFITNFHNFHGASTRQEALPILVINIFLYLISFPLGLIFEIIISSLIIRRLHDIGLNELIYLFRYIFLGINFINNDFYISLLDSCYNLVILLVLCVVNGIKK